MFLIALTRVESKKGSQSCSGGEGVGTYTFKVGLV